jgi:hypothetical protein
MQQSVFKAELQSAGYTEIESNARSEASERRHAHDYDIRGLVLNGVFIVKQDGNPVTYRAGEVFAVPQKKATPRRSGRTAHALSSDGNF